MIDHDAFMLAWRAARPKGAEKIPQAEYDLVLAAIAGIWTPPPAKPAASVKEPAWLGVARDLIGTKEIVGPKHNAWIVQQWAKLGAKWFNDDETPWCGLFVAACMAAVGQPYPTKGLFARARAWADWGKPVPPTIGAVVVFSRDGGGHVGFLVGQNDGNYYVLGGNQSNAVNITPISKARAIATRWPAGLALPTINLPRMSGGTVSKNEA